MACGIPDREIDLRVDRMYKVWVTYLEIYNEVQGRASLLSSFSHNAICACLHGKVYISGPKLHLPVCALCR